jgi:methyl-accepting chemotaxis protein
MSFDDAMASHIVWKLRLTRFIDGSGGEDFDKSTAGRTELCDLGRWMLDEGANYQAVPAFDSLQKEHADFHSRAAEVIRKVESGDQAGAKLVVDGPFEAASRGVIRAIVELREQVARR